MYIKWDTWLYLQLDNKSFCSLLVLIFCRWYHIGLQKIQVSLVYLYVPLDLHQLLHIRIDMGFEICIVNAMTVVNKKFQWFFSQSVNAFITINSAAAGDPAEFQMGALVNPFPQKSHNIDGLVQDCSNSIVNALELMQSCTKPSIWHNKWWACFSSLKFQRSLLN